MLIAFVGYSFGVTNEAIGIEDDRAKSNQQREQQIQQLAQECARSIVEAAPLPSEQSIPLLGYVLKRLGGWQRPDTLAVYHEAQSKLLSIPGHATYFRDKLKAAQAEVKAGSMTLGTWDNLRIDSFQTLKHLPSEETVSVLMEFVNDHFADLNSKNPEDYESLSSRDPHYLGSFTVQGVAATTLEALGIQPPPYKDPAKLRYEENLELWNQWWDQVKAGKRKYRFKGSTVDHPVNAPPGTAREVRRPERHPEPPLKEKTSQNPVPEQPRSEREKGPQWSLFVAIAVALAAVMLYFIKRKGRA